MKRVIKVARKLGRFLERRRRNVYVKHLDAMLLAVHKAIENQDYDFWSNGECWAIKEIANNHDVRVVFDVGANIGNWSMIAAEEFRNAQLHAFEVVPNSFVDLKNNFKNNRSISLNNVGLSDDNGFINVYYDPKYHSTATSVAGFSEKFHGYRPTSSMLPVMTGDKYCAENNIQHIDFLKIDVEGHEPQVLEGFIGMLEKGAIDIIQFEYGYINIDTRFLLKDFYSCLERFDMCIGRIYSNYVEFREYKHCHEDFCGPNFLAVRSCHEALIRHLSGKK